MGKTASSTELNFSEIATVSYSKIFLILCLSFIFGVALASFFVVPLLVLGILAIVAIILVAVFRNNAHAILLGFALLVLALGSYWFLRYAERADESLSLSSVGRGAIEIIGVIQDDPETFQKISRFVVGAEQKILVTTDVYPEYHYGDKVKITGVIKEPDDGERNGFDEKSYLRKDQIYLKMDWPNIELIAHNQGNPVYSALFKLKNRFEEITRANLSEPYASVMNGIILGERITDKKLKDDFNRTGLSHITALSGYNVSIIAIFLTALFNSLLVSRRISFLLSVAFIVLFVLLTGAEASVVRAAIMGILILVARNTGRPSSAIYSLVFAGMIMIFLNPMILRFDLGFQLSFLAMLGLIYLSPFFEKKFITFHIPQMFGIREYLSATLSAILFTAPLILYHFGTFSLVAPIANILVLPAIPWVMLFGFLAGMLGFLFAPLAAFVSSFSYAFLFYIVGTIRYLSSLDFSSLYIGSGSIVFLIIYYVVLIVILVKMRAVHGEPRSQRVK